MKKLFILAGMTIIMSACNNAKTSNEKVGEDIEPYRQVGVQNVNGNIPDTSNSIDLSTRKPDSAYLGVDTPMKK